MLKTSKTDTSERKVYIPGFVAQCLIDIKKEQDEVFHSLRHTSVTYKLKLSDGDIKAVQGDSGHAQADMVTEVYGHILDEDRKKNAQMMEDVYKRQVLTNGKYVYHRHHCLLRCKKVLMDQVFCIFD